SWGVLAGLESCLPGRFARWLAQKVTTTVRVQSLLPFLISLSMGFTLGCSHGRYCCQEDLAQRILPPVNSDVSDELPKPRDATKDISTEREGRQEQPESSKEQATEEAESAPAQASELSCESHGPLTLADAIDIAFRSQPRLRVYLETVEQARRAE